MTDFIVVFIYEPASEDLDALETLKTLRKQFYSETHKMHKCLNKWIDE